MLFTQNANEPIEKVTFLKTASSAGSKIELNSSGSDTIIGIFPYSLQRQGILFFLFSDVNI